MDLNPFLIPYYLMVCSLYSILSNNCPSPISTSSNQRPLGFNNNNNITEVKNKSDIQFKTLVIGLVNPP